MRRITSELCLKCWRVRFVGFAAILVASSAAWLGAPRGKSPTIPELIRSGKVPAQLESVPSHNRLYRASLRPSRNEWKLRLETSNHEPVSGATLVMQPWMPEDPAVSADRPRVIAKGEGVYRVEGLGLDRPGWWNIKLEVTSAGKTDSLAFNIIMP